MLGPAIEVSRPPSFFFNFPPSSTPETLPPPPDSGPFRALFDIPPSTYQAWLSPSVPITFAAIYLTTVTLLNSYNRRNGFKAWAISKTNLFQAFVLLHNIGLACYSALTCAAMLRTISVSVPSVLGPHGFLGTVDALCKINGPRGYGDAVTYDVATAAWAVKNKAIHLAEDGLTPDSTDVGRIWNEGLAFWGWIFYISKFYEVVDTLIILAKGKRSSTLQMYHHAGAMLCMWAGIRYMSPPIWMFVLVNSGIHAMMYTYYSLAALKVPVPSVIKRTITTMQIIQFLVGANYAAMHLFVYYTVPVSVPVKIASAVLAAPSVAVSAISEDKLSWFKKLALRAGGAEGLAERVTDAGGNLFGPEHSGQGFSGLASTRYRTDYELIRCLDTSGQAFAIWLNILYLAPLTGLFARFFWKSYITRNPTNYAAPRGATRRMSDLARIAVRKTSDAVETIGKGIEDSVAAVRHEVQTGGGDLGLNEYVKKMRAELREATAGAIGGQTTEEEHHTVVRGDKLFTGSGEQTFSTPSRTTRVVQEIDAPGGNGRRVVMDRVSRVDSEGNIRVEKSSTSHSEQTWMRKTSTGGDSLNSPSSPDGGFGLNG